MSEPPPPETPTGAARALIGWFAGGLAFQSVETLAAGRDVAAAEYFIAAVVVAVMDYKLPWLLSKISPGFTRSLNRVAGDAAWWVASVLVVLLFLTFSPYVEQNRWPYAHLFDRRDPSAQEIATAVAPLIKAELGEAKLPAPQTPPPDVFKLISSLRAQLDTKTQDEVVTQRQLDIITQQLALAQKPPLDPARVPTWLELSFDSTGVPSEEKSTNIHWSSWAGGEYVACPLAAFGSTQILQSTLSPSNDCTSSVMVIFLSFDKPISYENISLTAAQTLPQWEVFQKGPKTAIILVHGKIVSSTISIEVIK